MEMMTQFYKEKDWSQCKDYRELFSTHEDYMRAVKDMKHYFHNEALTIWKNRHKKLSFYTREYSFVGNPDF